MKILKDLITLEIDFFNKPKSLPTGVFKVADNRTYKTLLSALIIYDSPYQFLLSITHLLDPIHKDTAKKYMKDPNKYGYFVEWFVQSRCLLESQMLTDYLALGESSEGRAVMKVLEKRFKENFNDKIIEFKQLKEIGAIKQESSITFTLA